MTAVEGERIEIPVYIMENEGIMGFRMIVDYPVELLHQVKVRVGSLTGDGMFDSRTTPDGHIEVLWCATSDVRGDGSLFVLEFTVREGVQNGSAELRLSYSQEDTFNEQWEDVVLHVSPILINITGNGSDIVHTDTTTTVPTSEATQPSSEYTEMSTEPTLETTVFVTEIVKEPTSEGSAMATEIPTEPNATEERGAQAPMLLIGLIVVVILGSIVGIFTWKRRK